MSDWVLNPPLIIYIQQMITKQPKIKVPLDVLTY